MRKKLDNFCQGRLCDGKCVLSGPVCRCGNGAYFTRVKGHKAYMTNEEIIDAYNLVFDEAKDLDKAHDTDKLKEALIDSVNNPSHYTDGKIEVIDYIEDKKLGFCLGNAIKYISRAGKKDKDKEAEDIKKAIWYLKRYLKNLKEAN